MFDVKELGGEQYELECLSLNEGRERFLQTQESLRKHEGGHATAAATKLIRGSIPLVAAEIAKYLSSADRKGVGATPPALSILSMFDDHQLAYIALNVVFDCITHDKTLTTTCHRIGLALQAECVAGALVEQRGKKTAERIQGVLAQQGSAKMRAKVFSKLVKSNGVEFEPWGNDKLLKTGEPLVNAVLVALPEVFELAHRSSGKRTAVHLQLTEEGGEMVLAMTEAVSWMRPMHRPMLTIPRKWESFDTGCYYDERVARTVRLVRTSSAEHRDIIKAAITDGSMAYCLEALNTIQETAWAINRPVLEALRWAWGAKLQIEGFPRAEAIPLPPRLSEDVWEAYSDVQKKGHRLSIAAILRRNRGIVSEAAVMLRDLSIAEGLTKYERFYLPHNLDFRGRVYPVCHFNNQRSDHIKGLFRFAQGKRLGPEGGAWLAIHLANCWDGNPDGLGKLSKRSFADRIDWVSRNADMLARVGRDPKGMFGTWSAADQPFMFLAATCDFAGWVESGYSDEYVSSVPIALDGSNSGLQHYSAALRSHEGSLVCLTPAEKPSDVYQVVADRLAPRVAVDALQGDPRAILIQKAGVGRSLVKRNVMTFAYSSEQFGFRQQLLEDTMRPLADRALADPTFIHPYALPKDDGTMDGGFACSGYLAAGVWKAVTETVHQATEGMAFFKAVAGVLAHEKQGLVWRSPIGLPILHKYTEWDTKQVKMWLYDRAMPITDAAPDDKVEEGKVIKRIRANIRTVPTDRIDKEKAKSAVAPNVIHSQDASHLMLTVLSAKDTGLTDFALIHDSFGTHAGSTEAFFHIIRESFVEMYEAFCPFQVVRDAAEEVLSPEGIERLPSLPTKGDLDLKLVLESLYAFA